MENKHTRSVSLIDGHIEETDVVKALECCINDECEDCPLYGENHPDVYGNCVRNTKRDALDLINRQKAQIQKLEKIERFATKTIEKQDAEIEKLNVELVGMRGACESYKIHYDNAQAEIESLKKQLEEAYDMMKPLV